MTTKATWKEPVFLRDGYRRAATRKTRPATKKFTCPNCPATIRSTRNSRKIKHLRHRRNSTPILHNSMDRPDRNLKGCRLLLRPSSSRFKSPNLENHLSLERKLSSVSKWKSRPVSVNDSSQVKINSNFSRLSIHNFQKLLKLFQSNKRPERFNFIRLIHRSSNRSNRFHSLPICRNREKSSHRRRHWSGRVNSFRPATPEKATTKAITTELKSDRDGRRPVAMPNTSRPIEKLGRLRRRRQVVKDVKGRPVSGHLHRPPFSINRPVSRDHLAQSLALRTSLKSNPLWS